MSDNRSVMEYYRYKPLNNFEFRLIRFENAELDGSVSFKICRVSLNSPPEYAALSYTWGKPFDELPEEWADPAATKEVFADGLKFSVQFNLEAALQRFQPELSLTGLFIWVDAICINQGDIAERNHQVALMGDIYGKAQQTLVWLGPGVNDSDHGLSILRELYNAWNRRPVHLQARPTPSSSDPPEMIDLYRLHMEREVKIINSEDDTVLPSPYTTEGLWHLLNRYWWRRAWVLQEVLLSRQTLVYCGASMPLDWNIIIAGSKIAASIRDSSYLFVNESFPGALAEIMCGKLEGMFPSDLSTPFIRLDAQGSIRNIISLLWSKKATDPRDKVYAGLGLVVNHQELDVDYNISVPELYMRVTKLCIEQEGNLKILSMCAQHEDQNIPSWVPNLSNNSSINPMSLAQDSGMTYAADGNLVFEPVFTETGLILKGLSVCVTSYVRRVEGNRHEFQKAEDTAPVSDSWLSTWLLSFVFLPRLPPLFTILNNEDVYQYNLTSETIWDAYLVTLAGGNEVPEDGLANPEFRRLVARMLSHRCFIASKMGIIGIGPKNSKVGDHIFITAGSEVPLLLRQRNDGKWSLVGECYAHGLMNGINGGALSQADIEGGLVEVEIV